MSIPPLYKSFEDNQEANCIFCKSSTNDVVLYGNKYTKNGITIHNFCLLFASGLQQKDEANVGILGYLEEDVKRELKRASKLTCFYCKLRGASIGCCRRS
ncbi:G2/M phase-specific E3 ubiquitin-protein ligase-like isoform X2 [Temnothorax americanus]|uniref:G2/M phase-specific E3 ubiquitin-protein ligase-like isoform X2 n=1 Tax=Temnothorax americanus TaxID=1964332 RepID=UPI004067F208